MWYKLSLLHKITSFFYYNSQNNFVDKTMDKLHMNMILSFKLKYDLSRSKKRRVICPFSLLFEEVKPRFNDTYFKFNILKYLIYSLTIFSWPNSIVNKK
jgi:hypothetical protein